MKLNFWQWLGLVLLVGAGAWWIYERTADTEQPPTESVPVATQPA
jgi:hypothetical protein